MTDEEFKKEKEKQLQSGEATMGCISLIVGLVVAAIGLYYFIQTF